MASAAGRRAASRPDYAGAVRGGAISVGVLTPHAAIGPEDELLTMAPGQVVTRVARISSTDADLAAAPPTSPAGLQALATPALLDEAAERLGVPSIDAVGYASTSSAYAIGFDEETALVSGLARRIGVPVVATCASAVLALRLLDVRRIALVHPPWFDEELNELGTAYFASQGLQVVVSASADVENDPDRIEPAAVCEWASRHVTDGAEAVFIGGNGFRAAAAIEPLETAIGRLVLESNQVLLWNLLGRAGAGFTVRGFGRLFAHEPAPGTDARRRRSVDAALPAVDAE
jgi:maleate isomerase